MNLKKCYWKTTHNTLLHRLLFPNCCSPSVIGVRSIFLTFLLPLPPLLPSRPPPPFPPPVFIHLPMFTSTTLILQFYITKRTINLNCWWLNYNIFWHSCLPKFAPSLSSVVCRMQQHQIPLLFWGRVWGEGEEEEEEKMEDRWSKERDTWNFCETKRMFAGKTKKKKKRRD